MHELDARKILSQNGVERDINDYRSCAAIVTDLALYNEVMALVDEGYEGEQGNTITPGTTESAIPTEI